MRKIVTLIILLVCIGLLFNPTIVYGWPFGSSWSEDDLTIPDLLTVGGPAEFSKDLTVSGSNYNTSQAAIYAKKILPLPYGEVEIDSNLTISGTASFSNNLTLSDSTGSFKGTLYLDTSNGSLKMKFDDGDIVNIATY